MTITTIKRADFDGVGTLQGLLELVGAIPTDVPLDAEIIAVYSYEGCPPEVHEAAGADLEVPEHDLGPRLALVFEWEPEADL